MINRAYYRETLEGMTDIQVHNVHMALTEPTFLSTIVRSVTQQRLPITMGSKRDDKDGDLCLGIDSEEGLAILTEEIAMRRDRPIQDTSWRYRLSKMVGGYV